MTQYDIFIHYYNESMNTSVTNQTKCKWYSCDTTKGNYKYIEEEDSPLLMKEYLDETETGKELNSKINKDYEALEFLYISKDDMEDPVNTKIYEKTMISGLSTNNPKYDMIFIWDGLGYLTNQKYGSDNVSAQLYYDKMKRVNFLPWFFHSKYYSLNAALSKANSLINIYGKEHVMIGKEVNFEQYIDII